jgi:hypothetical protein
LGPAISRTFTFNARAKRNRLEPKTSLASDSSLETLATLIPAAFVVARAALECDREPRRHSRDGTESEPRCTEPVRREFVCGWQGAARRVSTDCRARVHVSTECFLPAAAYISRARAATPRNACEPSSRASWRRSRRIPCNSCADD